MGDRNPKLSKLRPDDALEALNAQILAYSEGKAPFNRLLREQETPYDWWVKTSEDSAASVLGVCLLLSQITALTLVTDLYSPASRRKALCSCTQFYDGRTDHVHDHLDE